jgi:hypothetical protein
MTGLSMHSPRPSRRTNAAAVALLLVLGFVASGCGSSSSTARLGPSVTTTRTPGPDSVTTTQGTLTPPSATSLRLPTHGCDVLTQSDVANLLSVPVSDVAPLGFFDETTQSGGPGLSLKSCEWLPFGQVTVSYDLPSGGLPQGLATPSPDQFTVQMQTVAGFTGRLVFNTADPNANPYFLTSIGSHAVVFHTQLYPPSTTLQLASLVLPRLKQ